MGLNRMQCLGDGVLDGCGILDPCQRLDATPGIRQSQALAHDAAFVEAHYLHDSNESRLVRR